MYYNISIYLKKRNGADKGYAEHERLVITDARYYGINFAQHRIMVIL